MLWEEITSGQFEGRSKGLKVLKKDSAYEAYPEAMVEKITLKKQKKEPLTRLFLFRKMNYLYLRLRAASDFFLRFTLGFS